MIGWLYRMIIGRFSQCNHKWKTIKTIDMYENSYDKMSMGQKYIMRCEDCGNIKHKKSY